MSKQRKPRKSSKEEGLVIMPFQKIFSAFINSAIGRVSLISENWTQEEIQTQEDLLKSLSEHLESGEIYNLSLNNKTKELTVNSLSITNEEVKKLLDNPVVNRIIAGILKDSTPVKERLHKQPRALLKTVGRTIGNNTSRADLFTIQGADPEGGASNTLKLEISKTTAALAMHLMELYQESGGNGALVIEDLAPLAEKLRTTNHRLKTYLLYLGGYTYPLWDKNPGGGLSMTVEQLFKVVFHYPEKVGEKYTVKNGVIVGADRIGTDLANFIKDEPIERVEVTPNLKFLQAIQGRGLGNVLATDRLIELVLDVSDIAAKLLTYSSSNKPTQRIGEDKLIDQIGYQRALKNQGRPRVRQTILKGLQELKDRGHLKSFSFDEDRGLYSFTYSDTYVKHKDLKPAPEGVQ